MKKEYFPGGDESSRDVTLEEMMNGIGAGR